MLAPLLATLLASAFPAPAKEPPSLASGVIGSYSPKPADGAGERVARAKAFLESLDDGLREQAALPLDSPERARWTNVPPRGPQGGVRLGDLDAPQLKKACDFLASALSPSGYKQAMSILLADDLLLRDGQPRPGFGAENYWVAIFGEPDLARPWAMQFDGHHLAINVTYRGEDACYSPSFIGTQPAKVAVGGEEFEVMAGEKNRAFALVGSLDEKQRREAVRGGSRGRIQTAAGRDGVVPEPVGVSCGGFDDKQRQLLMALVGEWVNDLPEGAAEKRMAELAGEIDQMRFAWHGPTEPGSDASYRLQGPTLIIEYAGQDLGGDPSDHLHSMYRDPTNEYGKKLGAVD